MADREKVISEFEDFVNGYECFCTSDDYEYEMHKAVLTLLKEQKPVKPTWSRGKPYCGSCGLRIHGGKFCSECGRPVLWEGR